MASVRRLRRRTGTKTPAAHVVETCFTRQRPCSIDKRHGTSSLRVFAADADCRPTDLARGIHCIACVVQLFSAEAGSLAALSATSLVMVRLNAPPCLRRSGRSRTGDLGLCCTPTIFLHNCFRSSTPHGCTQAQGTRSRLLHRCYD